MAVINDIDKIDDEAIGLKQIIVTYLHHWKLFFGVFLLSLIPATLYLVYYPKTYEMMARIQLQDEKGLGSSSFGLGEAAGLMKSFGLGGAGNSSVNMDDEIVKFLSSSLLENMVLKLGININYYKPYAYKYRMYENAPVTLIVDSATNTSLSEIVSFNISIEVDGSIIVKTDVDGERHKFAYNSFPAEIKLPQGVFYISDINKEKGISSIDVDVVPAKWVAEELSDQLTIEEYSKTSNIIEFLCQDYEKRRGVDMLDTLISIYNEQENSFKKEEGTKSLVFLDDRINQILRDLSNTEHKIESYKLKNKMTNIEYDVQFYVEQMKELQVKIIELEAQNHVVNLLDGYVKDPRNKYNLIPSLLSSSDGGDKSSPTTLYNEALLERSRIMQSSKYDNPLIEKSNQQVEQLRKSVFLSIDNAQSSLNLTLADLKNKEKMIMDKMGEVPTLEKDYIELKRQQEIFQGVYLILLQKREEIALSIGEDRNKARIIDSAFVKENPIGPRKLFALLGVLLLTLVIPVVYLFVKEQLLDLYKEFLKTKK